MLNPRRWVVVLLGASMALAVVACGDDDDDDDASPAETAAAADNAAASLPGSTWVLATASALDGKELAAVGTATLEFDADGTTLAGSTGCNRFSGSYVQSGSDLSITLGPVTRARASSPAPPIRKRRSSPTSPRSCPTSSTSSSCWRTPTTCRCSRTTRA